MNREEIARALRRLPCRPAQLFNHLLFKMLFLFSAKKDALDVPGETKRVLILAPHIDDDIIGCGGTISRYINGGARVHILYLTDGRRSRHPFLNEEQLKEERKREAHRVAELYGLQDLYFLDNIDGSLCLDHQNVEKVMDLVEQIQPDVVFVPFFLDYHLDHIETNRIFIEAARKAGWEMSLLAYQIQCPLSPGTINRIVDIDSSILIKQKALELYKSQVYSQRFFQTVLDLNRYQSSLARKKCRYVEVFLHLDIKKYAYLFKRIDERYNISKHLEGFGDHYSLPYSFLKGAKLRREVKKIGSFTYSVK